MTTNFNLTSGKNRALVFYCNADAQAADIDALIDSVFASQNIEPDPLAVTIEDRNSKPRVFKYHFDPSITSLNIALGYENVAKRLKVGGSFVDVCVGVFFYNALQPIDTRGTMAEVNEFFGEDVAPEPPSLTSLVCNALREAFGGVYGASAFVIPDDITSYTLEVK